MTNKEIIELALDIFKRIYRYGDLQSTLKEKVEESIKIARIFAEVANAEEGR